MDVALIALLLAAIGGVAAFQFLSARAARSDLRGPYARWVAVLRAVNGVLLLALLAWAVYIQVR